MSFEKSGRFLSLVTDDNVSDHASEKRSGEQDYQQENKSEVPNRQDDINRKRTDVQQKLHLSYTWEEEKKRSKRGMWEGKTPSECGRVRSIPVWGDKLQLVIYMV